MLPTFSATTQQIAAVEADVDQGETDSDAADAALSGRLDTLEADPTTATAVAAVQADVDQNEADGDAADAALSSRLDTLEADPTTATAVAAVQADVDSIEAAAARPHQPAKHTAGCHRRGPSRRQHQRSRRRHRNRGKLDLAGGNADRQWSSTATSRTSN